MRPCKIWIEQCNAARRIEDEFGTDKALELPRRREVLELPRSRRDRPGVPGGNPGVRRRDQDDLRALATGRVSGDGPPDRAIRPRHVREDDDPEDGRMERDRTTSGIRPGTCCWSSRQRDGCWTMMRISEKPRGTRWSVRSRLRRVGAKSRLTPTFWRPGYSDCGSRGLHRPPEAQADGRRRHGDGRGRTLKRATILYRRCQR